MAPSRGLRVRTRCTTLDQFVSWFEAYCNVSSFFLPTAVQSPLGAEVPFSLDLADGTPAFAGVGGVLETWPTAANRFGRPGMMIELRRLAQSSAPIFEKIKRAKAAAAAPVVNEFDVATEISAPSYEEHIGRRHIQTEDWDLRSAPIEKVEMVDVAPPKGAKRRAQTPTEPLPMRPGAAKARPADDADDPDEAAFTDDDLPTTLAGRQSDGIGGGEDAYVQMAPIADALDYIAADAQVAPPPVVLPLRAPSSEVFNIIVEPVAIAPVYTPPPPPVVAAPPRHRWLIAIAVIVVLVVGVGLVAAFLQ